MSKTEPKSKKEKERILDQTGPRPLRDGSRPLNMKLFFPEEFAAVHVLSRDVFKASFN